MSGKYWTVELSTTRSNRFAGNPVTSSAGAVRSRTTSASSGRCARCARRRVIAAAEMSLPQYSAQVGARAASSRPLPTPISSTRRGASARSRSTTADRHSRIAGSAMGWPS